MPNKYLQSAVMQFSDIFEREFGVTDGKGIVIVSNDDGKIGNARHAIIDKYPDAFDVYSFNGYTYKNIHAQNKVEYVIYVAGDDKEAEKYARILSVSIMQIKRYNDEKYDRSAFIKNIILDNILTGDIHVKSKELNFESEMQRVVYYIKFSGKTDVIPYDVIRGMYSDRDKEFVININETEIVLIKEFRRAEFKDYLKYETGESGIDESGEDMRLIELMAESIVNTIGAEVFLKASIGIGGIAASVSDLSRSFKEAKIALEVGKVFESERPVINYGTLGIGRLIYQLPTTLCEIFLQEVFKSGSYEALDQESFLTIQCFFENNLNVSETSRKLFVHRNTLVYRLEKIKKITGLDLREFEHAITFKVALMVKKYLTFKPIKY